MELMTREEFRNSVFNRDGHECVFPGCPKSAVDAHHIIERRLWDKDENEGYFTDNGASVCEDHHRLSELIIPTQMLREWCGITSVILPKKLDPNKDYDKWGNPLKMPTREYIKYPSTPYLPFSESIGNPVTDINLLLNMPLVISIKMDGSNSALTKEKIAARNGQYADHPSFDLLKAEFPCKKYLIPEGIQIFGEWLYAKHSIHYSGENKLSSYFQIFNIYDVKTRCFLGWDKVKEMSKRIGYPTVPVLAENVVYEKDWQFISEITKMARRAIERGHEGLVVRPSTPFHYGHFETHTGKYVRPNHVQTDEHWKDKSICRNEIQK